MIKQLQGRKSALQSVMKRMSSKPSLRIEEGIQYIRCLALLLNIEMQIEEIQINEKDRNAMRPR